VVADYQTQTVQFFLNGTSIGSDWLGRRFWHRPSNAQDTSPTFWVVGGEDMVIAKPHFEPSTISRLHGYIASWSVWTSKLQIDQLSFFHTPRRSAAFCGGPSNSWSPKYPGECNNAVLTEHSPFTTCTTAQHGNDAWDTTVCNCEEGYRMSSAGLCTMDCVTTASMVSASSSSASPFASSDVLTDSDTCVCLPGYYEEISESGLLCVQCPFNSSTSVLPRQGVLDCVCVEGTVLQRTLSSDGSFSCFPGRGTAPSPSVNVTEGMYEAPLFLSFSSPSNQLASFQVTITTADSSSSTTHSQGTSVPVRLDSSAQIAVVMSPEGYTPSSTPYNFTYTVLQRLPSPVPYPSSGRELSGPALVYMLPDLSGYAMSGMHVRIYYSTTGSLPEVGFSPSVSAGEPILVAPGTNLTAITVVNTTGVLLPSLPTFASYPARPDSTSQNSKASKSEGFPDSILSWCSGNPLLCGSVLVGSVIGTLAIMALCVYVYRQTCSKRKAGKEAKEGEFTKKEGKRRKGRKNREGDTSGRRGSEGRKRKVQKEKEMATTGRSGPTPRGKHVRKTSSMEFDTMELACRPTSRAPLPRPPPHQNLRSGQGAHHIHLDLPSLDGSSSMNLSPQRRSPPPPVPHFRHRSTASTASTMSHSSQEPQYYLTNHSRQGHHLRGFSTATTDSYNPGGSRTPRSDYGTLSSHHRFPSTVPSTPSAMSCPPSPRGEGYFGFREERPMNAYPPPSPIARPSIPVPPPRSYDYSSYPAEDASYNYDEAYEDERQYQEETGHHSMDTTLNSSWEADTNSTWEDTTDNMHGGYEHDEHHEHGDTFYDEQRRVSVSHAPLPPTELMNAYDQFRNQTFNSTYEEEEDDDDPFVEENDDDQEHEEQGPF